MTATIPFVLSLPTQEQLPCDDGVPMETLREMGINPEDM
jgi:hypothetical protein